MNVTWEMTIEEKLRILGDAAKYDVSCVSSGVDRKGDGHGLGNAQASGICHSFTADGRCVSLLKILMSNDCCYDCKYCINRVSNDVERATFTPEEICQLTVEFYRRNYIEGLFLSSGIIHSPNYTMEQMYITLWKLRNECQFQGYIHIKIIPGTDAELIERIGFLADRVSCNLELPTAQGLKTLAPAKNRQKILEPMRQIKHTLLKQNDMGALPALQTGSRTQLDGKMSEKAELSDMSSFYTNQKITESKAGADIQTKIYADTQTDIYTNMQARENTDIQRARKHRQIFVPAGQSTQMIVGATPETDYQILNVTEALYQKFNMERVFYSAYVPLNEDSQLPGLEVKPPLLREHRLYQADWLLRYYGFKASELLNEHRQNFNVLLDPKCDWAIGHLEYFPVEVNTADYAALLRVPGIGVQSARRICQARRFGKLDFNDLKRMGIVLKRALYFITCSGHMMYPVKIDEDYITRNILDVSHKMPAHLREAAQSYRQLSLFDDFHIEART